MKKLFFALLAIVAFASCEKDPDLDKVQDDYLVYTQYDKNANFQSFKTYYVPDSILLISNKSQANYWTGTNAEQIVNTYVTNLDKRGFTRVTDKEDADLGLQLSYIENTQYVADWWGDYPWLDYPYYWAPDYWWPGYVGPGWYYPYPVVYTFSTGTLMGELVDLKSVSSSGSSSQKVPVLWSSLTSGFLYGSNNIDLNKAVAAINQAFSQSAYLKTTAATPAK